jgi:DNA repair exonuclease SbcCD ATPase subunit
MKILQDSGKKIRKVIQIADIHIRKNGNRYEEYEKVFEELYKELEKNKEDALIVVCGDVYHEPMTSEANSMVKMLFVNMSKYCDIVVFFGNHDQVSRTNPDLKDSLTSSLENIKTEKSLYMLEKTGTYIYENLAFGYTNIYDKSAYVIAEDVNKKIKIALWHGTLNGSKTSLNQTLENSKFNSESFKDYEYGFFGDIHLQQSLNKCKTFWYSGSIIQQDHGESIDKHGIMIHDLIKKTSKHIELYNKYCFLTVHIKDKKVKSYDRNLIKDKIVDLKIVYEGDSLETAKKELDEITKICKVSQSEIIKKTLEDCYVNKELKEINVTNNEMMVKKLMDYVEKLNKYEDIEKDKMKSILTNHTKMLNHTFGKQKNMIKLKTLVFNNYCLYGEGNCIEFSELSGVVNVAGINGLGKSNLIDCLLYTIYGSSKSSSVDINSRMLNMECMAIFDINGVEYKIIRGCFFKGLRGDKSHASNIIEFYKDNVEIAKKDISMINKQIIELFGEKEDFLLTYVMTQKKPENFLDLSDKERTKYICRIADLDVYDRLVESLKNEGKKKKNEILVNEKKLYVYHKTNDKDKLINVRNQKEEEKRQKMDSLIKLKEDQEKLEIEYEKINKEKILKEQQLLELNKSPTQIDPNGVLSEIELLKQQKKKIENKIRDINERKNAITTIIESNESHILQKEEIEKRNEEYEKNKLKVIKKLDNEIDDILRNITKYEKEIDINKEIKDLEKKLVICKERKEEMIKTIESKKKEILVIEGEINEYEEVGNREELDKKYDEVIVKLVEIEKEENVKNAMLKDINEKLIEFNKLNDIEKIKKCHNEKKKLIKLNERKLEEYKNITKENKKYNENKKERIEELEKEKMELMKKYQCSVKKQLTKKEINKINENIKKIEKDNEIKQKELKRLQDIVSMDKKKINTIDCDMNQLKKIHEKYLEYTKESDLMKEEMDSKTRYLSEMEKHLEMKKAGHQYNLSCEACMANKITLDILNTEQEIKSQEQKISDIDKKLKGVIKKRESYRGDTEKYELMVLTEKENREIEEKINKLGCDILRLEMLIEKNNIDIRSNRDQIVENESIISNMEKNKEIDISIEKINMTINELENSKFTRYEEYLELLNDKNNALAEIEKLSPLLDKYQTYENEKDKLQKELDGLVDNKKQTNKKYSKFKDYDKKKKEYTENKVVLKNLERDIILLNSQIECNNKDINDYENSIENLKQTKKVIEKNEKLEKEKNKKKKELERIKETENEEYIKYMNMVKENEELKNESLRLDIEFNKLEKEKDLLENKMIEKKNLLEIIGQCEKIKIEFNKINDDYNELRTKRDKYKLEIEFMGNGICGLELEINYLLKTEKETLLLEKEKSLIDNIIEIINNGYIDNLLSSFLIPEITDAINSILCKFYNFKIKIEYTEKRMDVFKVDKYGNYQDANKLSGGEYALTNIIFKLVIHRINKLYKSNFLIIDEGFAYCDEIKITKLENLFKYFEKEYDFVLIITHDNTLASYTKTTTMLSVIEEKGFSKICYIKDDKKYKQYTQILSKASGIKESAKEVTQKDKKINYKKINEKLNTKENDDDEEQIQKKKKYTKKTVTKI